MILMQHSLIKYRKNNIRTNTIKEKEKRKKGGGLGWGEREGGCGQQGGLMLTVRCKGRVGRRQ
jgi:hypothetical protein